MGTYYVLSMTTMTCPMESAAVVTDMSSTGLRFKSTRVRMTNCLWLNGLLNEVKTTSNKRQRHYNGSVVVQRAIKVAESWVAHAADMLRRKELGLPWTWHWADRSVSPEDSIRRKTMEMSYWPTTPTRWGREIVWRRKAIPHHLEDLMTHRI